MNSTGRALEKSQKQVRIATVMESWPQNPSRRPWPKPHHLRPRPRSRPDNSRPRPPLPRPRPLKIWDRDPRQAFFVMPLFSFLFVCTTSPCLRGPGHTIRPILCLAPRMTVTLWIFESTRTTITLIIEQTFVQSARQLHAQFTAKLLSNLIRCAFSTHVRSIINRIITSSQQWPATDRVVFYGAPVLWSL